MKRSGWLVCMGVAVISATLVGCHSSGADSSSTGTSSAAANGPAKPTATADENTWGTYLAAQGKLHGKDVGMRPYIYVIPGGDTVAATSRRKDEADSISHSIGPILMPGGILIVGGPDGQQTSTFISDLSKTLKTDSLKGIVVLVIGDAAQAKSVGSALKPTGATVRFVAM